jgi:hypothetical protein
LIPAAFGIAFLGLGALAAASEKARKHAMHAAAALGILGCLGSFRGLLGLVTLLAEGQVERPLAVASQSLMFLLCLAFVALCVKSFVDARRRRLVKSP